MNKLQKAFKQGFQKEAQSNEQIGGAAVGGIAGGTAGEAAFRDTWSNKPANSTILNTLVDDIPDDSPSMSQRYQNVTNQTPQEYMDKPRQLTRQGKIDWNSRLGNEMVDRGKQYVNTTERAVENLVRGTSANEDQAREIVEQLDPISISNDKSNRTLQDIADEFNLDLQISNDIGSPKADKRMNLVGRMNIDHSNKEYNRVLGRYNDKVNRIKNEMTNAKYIRNGLRYGLPALGALGIGAAGLGIGSLFDGE